MQYVVWVGPRLLLVFPPAGNVSDHFTLGGPICLLPPTQIETQTPFR